MYVFLDESGDLGFDLTKGGTSRFFIICLLVIPTTRDQRFLEKAVDRTIHHKIFKSRVPHPLLDELKGSKTDLAVKKYFYRQAIKADFSIYTVVLNKNRVYDYLQQQPERLYNFIAKTLIEKCSFLQARDRIILTLDRRKAPPEIRAMNQYLMVQLEGSLPLSLPFEIFHNHSWENRGLQAVDLFSWGIFRKYERGDTAWYDMFKDRISYESIYLPPSK